MIFGKASRFAIEIGDQEKYPDYPGVYVQFRFWISGIPIGDWDDRIAVSASVGYASTVCDTQPWRQRRRFASSVSGEVFRAVYDDYFSCDYMKQPVVAPDLRDTFHLDGVGMGAVQDKYGLVLVTSSEGLERLIAKDLRQDRFVADIVVPLGFVESVLCEYIAWGKALLAGAE